MTGLAVAADDRTGALETAAACADAGFTTRLHTHPAARYGTLDRLGADVVDLRTRHATPGEARTRAALAEAWPGGHHAHKIDSTLRGNWAVELAGRIDAGRRRIVVLAAFPAAGRVCRDGVVLDHGVPVAEGPAGRDPRHPVHDSEPAVHLARAGVVVTAVRDADALTAWLARGDVGVVGVDATTDADVGAVAHAVAAHPDVLLAGTAAAIGALADAIGPGRRQSLDTALGTPVLVVVGSAHPMARRQVAGLVAAGAIVDDGTATDADRARWLVLVAPDEPGDPLAVCRALAARALARHDRRHDRTLVLVGGDTADAVLGERALTVEGSLGIGVARCHLVDDPSVTVVTKPGGFGDEGTLVRLLTAGAPA